MQRHSEHRLRFGIERSVDKPAAVAEFSASLGTNWVAHAARAADNGEALHVIVAWVDPKRAARWIRRRVPLKHYPYNYFGDGARYDPKTDTWSSLSITDAPTPRAEHSAVWTGSEMIVWGLGRHGYVRHG
jgi:hypothetical protein